MRDQWPGERMGKQVRGGNRRDHLTSIKMRALSLARGIDAFLREFPPEGEEEEFSSLLKTMAKQAQELATTSDAVRKKTTSKRA